VRPQKLKMAFYGSQIGTTKIERGTSGLCYQDCFMKQTIFVKNKEITSISVSPSLQRDLAMVGIQGMSLNLLNANVSKTGSVHLNDDAGPFVDTLKNGEAVAMPQKNLDSISEPNLTSKNDPGQCLLTPDCFQPTSRGANELHNSSKMHSPGLEGSYANVRPLVAISDVATSVTKLRPLDANLANTSLSTETAFDSIIVGDPSGSSGLRYVNQQGKAGLSLGGGVNSDGLIPPPQMLGGPFCPLKG
jgi:hypothetical protein